MQHSDRLQVTSSTSAGVKKLLEFYRDWTTE